jgi:hypothetical protein
VAAILLAAGVSSQAAPVKLTHANAGYTINTALGSPYIGSSVVPLTATTWGTVNSQGVVQVKINNVVVYHPVNSAWFINQMLSSYRVTENREYLRRAEATTRYILAGSFSDASGATWFPYNFRHTPGNKIDMGRDQPAGHPWPSDRRPHLCEPVSPAESGLRGVSGLTGRPGCEFCFTTPAPKPTI